MTANIFAITTIILCNQHCDTITIDSTSMSSPSLAWWIIHLYSMQFCFLLKPHIEKRIYLFSSCEEHLLSADCPWLSAGQLWAGSLQTVKL